MKPAPAMRGLSLLALFLTAGCVSLEQAAPPVATLGLSWSDKKLARMEQGRDIYVTRCAKCHSAEPIKKYSQMEWEKIMPKMSVKTKLTFTEDALVRDYVSGVLGCGL